MKLSLGRLLFPRVPQDQRRHKVHILLASTLVALILSGIISIVMLMTDQMTKYWLARL